MANTKTPRIAYNKTERFPFVGSPTDRDGTIGNYDQQFINMYPESIKSQASGVTTKFLVKRPGLSTKWTHTAGEGRGIIAGGAVRTVVELAGIKDIVSKSYGTSNKLNVARATIEALKNLRPAKEIVVDEAIVEEDGKEIKKTVKKATTKKVAKKATKKATKKPTFQR